MKGYAAIVILLGVTAAETGIETRLNQLVDKKELHMQRSRLLNELESVDKQIHAIEMADDAAAANTTKANDTKDADDTLPPRNLKAEAILNTIFSVIVSVVAIGIAAIYWFKCRKPRVQYNEGGETDDKYAKFIDNEIAK